MKNFNAMIEKLPKIKHTGSGNFFLLAGPCLVEGEAMANEIAEKLVDICGRLKVPLVFKGSYRKANRSRMDSSSGIGDEKALEILKKIGGSFDVPTVTDIHESREAALAAKYVDMLQIPAFLVRQTELLVAAAKTGKFVNLKKAQFMAPESMKFAVQKVTGSGNRNVLITDRGTMFGYSDLIVDFTGIPEMKNYAPVIMDITHSLQKPNTAAGVTGGKPQLIETIAKAAVAVGVDGIFVETHPQPSKALSDGANMLPLDGLEALLKKLIAIRKALAE